MVDFAVPIDHRVKLKESEKNGKLLKFARITEIIIIIHAWKKQEYWNGCPKERPPTSKKTSQIEQPPTTTDP